MKTNKYSNLFIGFAVGLGCVSSIGFAAEFGEFGDLFNYLSPGESENGQTLFTSQWVFPGNYIQDNTVSSYEIKDYSIIGDDIAPNTIGTGSLTYSAYVDLKDNLGNHSLTQNLTLNNNYISNNGSNNGILVGDSGNVAIGVNAVLGNVKLYSELNTSTGYAIQGSNSLGTAIYGEGINGVYGITSSPSGAGVIGVSSNSSVKGYLGYNTYSFYGEGDMKITGEMQVNTLKIGSTNFTIPPTCSGSQFLQWNGSSWLCKDTAASCTLGGTTVTHGGTVTFYNAPSNASCPSISQSRTCSNGVLSGDAAYQYASCVGTASCELDGVTVAHDTSRTFYSTPSNASCGSFAQSRRCNNGSLDGSTLFQYASCVGTASCELDGVTVAHGTGRNFYTTTISTACSSNMQYRSCNNGVLSESSIYNKASCRAYFNCSSDGVTVPHGGGNYFYAATTNSNCEGIKQYRTCNDGSLSGSYPYSTCSAPALSCWWSGFVIGPAPNPTASCSTANVGATTTTPWGSYTCVCY